MKAIDLPAWPRITGRVNDAPFGWRICATDDELTIQPRFYRFVGTGYWMALICGIIASLGFILFCLQKIDAETFMFVVAGSAYFGLGVVLFQRLRLFLYQREIRRGPLLQIDSKTRRICLPRYGSTWAFQDIVSVDVLSGRYVRSQGRYDKPNWSLIPTTEMQLVVLGSQGMIAVPLVGAVCYKSEFVCDLARQIAKRLNVPLNVVDDEQMPAVKNGE